MTRLSSMTRCRSGSSAVEFALVGPLFLLVLFTMIAYSLYLSTASSIERLAADASRTAIAGIDSVERSRIAQSFVSDAALGYHLIDPEALTVSVSEDGTSGHFTVSLRYSAESLPIWKLFTFSLPAPEIERSATIRIAGGQQ